MVFDKKPDPKTVNKIAGASLIGGLLVVIMLLSWIASPDPFPELMMRSLIFIYLFLHLIMITLAGANLHVRYISALLTIPFGIMELVISDDIVVVVSGLALLFIGLIILCDALISTQGCASPMELNANDSFITFMLLFVAAFAVGFFFEWLNETLLHIWSLDHMDDFYPMIELAGVNLVVVFIWTIIGILLYEFMLLVTIVTRKSRHGQELACRLE